MWLSHDPKLVAIETYPVPAEMPSLNQKSQSAAEGELGGDRDPVEQQRAHRLPRREREAQARPAVLVTREEVLEEQPVLYPHRLVEAELLADLRDGLRGRLLTRERDGRVRGRHDEEDQEGDQGDDQHDDRHPQQPADDVAPHRSRALGRWEARTVVRSAPPAVQLTTGSMR